MAAKRTRINSGRGGTRFVRRNKQGELAEVDAVGRSVKQDRPRKAKTAAKAGQGDKGDHKTSSRSSRSSARGVTRAGSRGGSRGRASASMKRGSGRKSR